MTILWITLKSLFSYGVLSFVSINLVGLFVRGLVQPNHTEPDNSFQSDPRSTESIGVTIFGAILISGFLYAVYYFGNAWLLVSAILLSLNKIPDAVHEIKTGKKVSLSTTPKSRADVIAKMLGWLALPANWYGFYRM